MWEVVMPRLDPAMQSGKIIEWLKKPGEKVTKGEAILVVEGEKTTFEIESPADGVVRRILCEIGDDVPVTSVLAYVGAAEEPIPETMARPAGPEEPRTPLVGQQTTRPRGVQFPASPAARRLAQEHGIALESLAGTGPGGRITREDVIAATGAATAKASEAKPFAPKVAKRFRLSGVRKAVAERLAYSSRTSVPVALTTGIDMSRLVDYRKSQGSVESGISITAIIVKAAAKALGLHPELNSTLEGDEVVYYGDVNVAVAINTEDGLIAPVVHSADRKGLHEISKEIELLAEKAQRKELEIPELTGGTFTVTNLGGFSVDSFVPTINPPQCAILAVGRTLERLTMFNGSVFVRPTANLTLVFDHRITDGLPAAKFLETTKALLEKMDLD